MKTVLIVLAGASIIAGPAHAENGLTANQTAVLNRLLATYAEKAKVEAREIKEKRGAISDQPFSADEGKKFYLTRRTWQSRDFTCSGCHTTDPRNAGKHIENKLDIRPLAPSANPERFVDAQKVESNFTAHCMDLHERDCTAYEKGNFITYLMSLR